MTKGPKNPPRLEKQLATAILAAAAGPRRNEDGMLQYTPIAAETLETTTKSAVSTSDSRAAVLATMKPKAPTNIGSATWRKRSRLLSLEWPQRFMTSMATAKKSATTKPVARLEKPMACTICGSHRRMP